MLRSMISKGGVYGTVEENSRGSGRALLAVYSWRDQSSRLCPRGGAFRRRRPIGCGDCRGTDAELRLGAAGAQGRRAHHGELRDRALTEWEWVHPGLFRAAVQGRYTPRDGSKTAWSHRHPREPWVEP